MSRNGSKICIRPTTTPAALQSILQVLRVAVAVVAAGVLAVDDLVDPVASVVGEAEDLAGHPRTLVLMLPHLRPRPRPTERKVLAAAAVDRVVPADEADSFVACLSCEEVRGTPRRLLPASLLDTVITARRYASAMWGSASFASPSVDDLEVFR